MRRISIIIISIYFFTSLESCQRDNITNPTISIIPSNTSKKAFTSINLVFPTKTMSSSSTYTYIPTVVGTFIGGGMGKMVFEYEAGVNAIIGVVDLKEPNKKIIIGDYLSANYPSWSSFYQRLYYYAKLNSENDNDLRIYSSNIDGSDIKPVNIPNNVEPIFITISPDGKQVLAWASSTVGKTSILYKGEFDGNSISNMKIFHEGGFPSWSPDGSKILFSLGYDMRTYNIYVENTDGTNKINLSAKTNSDVFAVYPIWSPDGKKIIYNTNRDNNPEIYEMNSDGSNPIKIYDKGCNPTYSPDGKLIAFTMGDNYCWGNIYIMNNDGTNVVKLINCLNNCRNPIWIS